MIRPACSINYSQHKIQFFVLLCYNKYIHIQLRQYSSAVFCLSLADVRKTEDFMDKENNPAPDNDSRDKSQEKAYYVYARTS